jgi:UDP:flavonoid glycosyltransferase YjiC (YdhE family)
MRVLFTVSPGLGHLFPTISLAWALRAAGHEVLVATAAEGVTAAVRAGLAAVATAPGAAIDAIFAGPLGAPVERVRRMRERGQEIARAGGRTHELLLRTFGQVSTVMADQTVQLARSWRPDLVVHSRLQGTGLLVARMLDIPAVEHGFNLLREDDFAARFLPYLAESFARHRVPLELPRRAVIHVAPPELMSGTGSGWSMRYVPYNAGGLLPDWLWQPPARPRVLVTLGTVVPRLAGVGGLTGLLAAASRVDAEFVLALGEDADLTTLAPLPANVRPVGWTPLHPLLATCAAVVHHGGSGTTMTALSSGVPQLVLPHGADQFVNADLVVRHGVGRQAEPERVDSGILGAVLRDRAVRSAAAATAQRMNELPAPVDLVSRLVGLAS